MIQRQANWLYNVVERWQSFECICNAAEKHVQAVWYSVKHPTPSLVISTSIFKSLIAYLTTVYLSVYLLKSSFTHITYAWISGGIKSIHCIHYKTQPTSGLRNSRLKRSVFTLMLTQVYIFRKFFWSSYCWVKLWHQ